MLCLAHKIPDRPGSGNTRSPEASAPLGAGNLLHGAPNFPFRTGKFPLGAPTFPLRAGNFPLGTPNFPLRTGNFPLGAPTLPLQAGYFPFGAPTFPLGGGSMPFWAANFPLRGGNPASAKARRMAVPGGCRSRTGHLPGTQRPFGRGFGAMGRSGRFRHDASSTPIRRSLTYGWRSAGRRHRVRKHRDGVAMAGYACGYPPYPARSKLSRTFATRRHAMRQPSRTTRLRSQ